MDKPEPPDSLLDREPSPALIDEWTELLAAPRSHSDLTAGLPLVIFRISDDWFALSALIFERVVAPTAVRWIPFRSNQVFRGLVNVDGELTLCVSLEVILSLSAAVPASHSSKTARLCIIRAHQRRAAFEVDELLGKRTVEHSSFASTEMAASSSTAYVSSSGTVEGLLIKLLDTEDLSTAITKAVSW